MEAATHRNDRIATRREEALSGAGASNSSRHRPMAAGRARAVDARASRERARVPAPSLLVSASACAPLLAADDRMEGSVGFGEADAVEIADVPVSGSEDTAANDAVNAPSDWSCLREPQGPPTAAVSNVGAESLV